jgi:hypothetical protein
MNSASRSASVKSLSVDSFAVTRIILRSDLLPMAKVVLLAILDHDRFSRSQRGCVASHETLARETGTSARHVRRMLRILVDGGRIIVEPQEGNERPLRMGTRCTCNLGLVGPNCTDDLGPPGPQPRTYRSANLGPTGPPKNQRKRQEKSAVRPTEPQAVGRPPSEDQEPPLTAAQVMSMAGMSPAAQARAEAGLIRGRQLGPTGFAARREVPRG